MDDRTLDERLAALEGRLARVEARLGLGEAGAVPPMAESPPEQRQQGQQPASPPPIVLPPVAPGSAKPAILAELWQSRQEPEASPASPPLPWSRVADPRALEAQVGVKWVGWVGAILVVIGAALLIKYAYDHQWFGALSPVARLALMSLGGFALLAAGEVVLRRVGAVAAAGPFGAGVATLFVVSYAGFKYFELYGPNVSFVLMALVTLVGAGVAIRGNLVSIAVLAVVGGNVAPYVLRTDDPALTPLLAYLLMLLVVALSLAWWGREPKWWTLRGLALATICFWVAVPVLGIEQLPGQRGLVVGFALLYAGLFHAELVLSSLRRPVDPTYATGFAVPVPLGARDVAAEQRGLGVTFGLLVTALLTIAILLLYQHAPAVQRGAWTVGLGACCLAIGLVLPQLARRLRLDPIAPRLPPPHAVALAIGYRIQAAALLVVAVPVTLSGVWVTVAWAILGVAFAVAGAMLNLSVSRVAGVVVWMLAVAHLGLWTIGAGIAGGGRGPMAVWAVIFGEPIPAYAVLALAMTLIGHGIAALVREDWSGPAVAQHSTATTTEDSPAAPTTSEHSSNSVEPADTTGGAHNLNYESRTAVRSVPVAGPEFQLLATSAEVASAGVFLIAAFSALPLLGQTLAVLCYGWAMVGANRLARSRVLLPAGLSLIAAAGGKWLLVDTLGRWLETGYAGYRGYRPVYNPAAAVGAALVASAAVLLRVRPRGMAWRVDVRAVSGFAAVLILLWGVTMEIDRYFAVDGYVRLIGNIRRTPPPAGAAVARQVTISIFWSVYAGACVAMGFRLRVAGLRYFGLGLFAATVVKVMLVDLSEVQTGYRILSFLALGLLLLGTSVLYGKLGPVLLGDDAREGRNDTAGKPAG